MNKIGVWYTVFRCVNGRREKLRVRLKWYLRRNGPWLRRVLDAISPAPQEKWVCTQLASAYGDMAVFVLCSHFAWAGGEVVAAELTRLLPIRRRLMRSCMSRVPWAKWAENEAELQCSPRELQLRDWEASVSTLLFIGERSPLRGTSISPLAQVQWHFSPGTGEMGVIIPRSHFSPGMGELGAEMAASHFAYAAGEVREKCSIFP
ncbi:hypothetical protein PIB30_066556 [Stylosanthes scabra]|uniref:Uncharacterized protein n=1 Tax=Stylosanthes scabra TaxID=79078 RepID=A0ABU6YP65_9FABA|nr:hypothetical protein [Stylosanthes scabra]